MSLERRTLQKLLREDFPGTQPLVVAASKRAEVVADLRARLERIDGVDTQHQPWVAEADKPHHVCSFGVRDTGDRYHYGSGAHFRLFLDGAGRLTIRAGYRDDTALVSDLEEVLRFAIHCKQHFERHKALRARRTKVRDLVTQAILAQIRKLAKEERFDFMTMTNTQNLNLYVKLADDHVVRLRISFKDFKQILPHLGAAIASLRKLHESGIRFQSLGPQSLPRRTVWTKHESL